jgi:hypothetical protein
MGSGAKSYMRKDFLIYEEMRKYFTIYTVRRPLVINDFAPDPSEFPYSVYEEDFILFFISVYIHTHFYHIFI